LGDLLKKKKKVIFIKGINSFSLKMRHIASFSGRASFMENRE